MQGRKDFQPELFSTVNLDALIPANHILRKIDRALDLSFVRELTADLYCKDNGRPSIDPELFLRMIFLAHLCGIPSDRKLCEEVGYNLSYRWFCKLNLQDAVPDHSSLTRTRDRFGEQVFAGIFERIVKVCIDRKIVKGKSLMTDGSLIKANASLDSVKRIGPVEEGGKNRINKIIGSKISNQTHMSRSDPDATIAGKANQPKILAYKVHESIDRDSRVIVDCHITTGSVHDISKFQSRVETIVEKFDLPVKEVIADRGYGSAENLIFLKAKKIRSIIPLYTNRCGQGTSVEPGFKFSLKNDHYVCPEGKVLHRTKNGEQASHYVSPAAVCRACPRFETCVGVPQKRQGRGKVLNRNIHQRVFEWALRRQKTWLFKKTLNERMWKMEGIFAEGKNQHGLRRARYRGRAKVQIQAYIIASIQNLKRLAAFILWLMSEIFKNRNFFETADLKI